VDFPFVVGRRARVSDRPPLNERPAAALIYKKTSAIFETGWMLIDELQLPFNPPV
jgi:hypothetical protein